MGGEIAMRIGVSLDPVLVFPSLYLADPDVGDHFSELRCFYVQAGRISQIKDQRLHFDPGERYRNLDWLELGGLGGHFARGGKFDSGVFYQASYRQIVAASQ